MNNWKSKAKLGRFGDTKIRKIDGKPAHVNALEMYMDPESVKRIGSGTINPDTGYKEYFLPIPLLVGGAKALYGMYQGGQQKKAYEAGVTAAGQIEQEGLEMVGKQKALDVSTADLMLEGAETQYASGVSDIQFSTQTGGQQIAQATGKTNLATSGSMIQKEEDFRKKIELDMKKLVDTRDLSSKKRDLAIIGAGLSEEEKIKRLEQQKEGTIASMDQGGAGQGLISGAFGAAGDIIGGLFGKA